jgi:hypothetical protein
MNTIYIFIHFFIHLFLCAYIVWVISPPCPLPTLSTLPPSVPGSSVLLLSLIFLKRRDKHNKEVKMFLLIKDSYTEIFLAFLSCPPVHVHPFQTDVTSLENEHKIKKKYGLK